MILNGTLIVNDQYSITSGAPFLEPRLFHCTIRSNGKFRVEEIANYEQDDLDPDDIMVLDGGDEVYVWIGNGSTEEEKEKSNEMAKVRIIDVKVSKIDS